MISARGGIGATIGGSAQGFSFNTSALTGSANFEIARVGSGITVDLNGGLNHSGTSALIPTELRLRFAYFNGNDNSSTFRSFEVQQASFNSTTPAVPEPAERAAITGLLTTGLAGLRRWRAQRAAYQAE